MAFLSVLCSNVRFPGIHPVHTFEYPRSWTMWLTLPLLIERLCAHWVVMHWSLQMMASPCCSISGLTAVTGQPEQGKSWSCDFPVAEAITLFTQNQPCFYWLQHFHQHCKDICGCFSPTLFSNKEFSHSTCLYHTPLTDSITRHSCSDNVRNLYNFLHKCWKIQICFT